MAGGRFVKLASGTLFGAGIGTAIAILFAPQSGEELQRKTKELWQQAQRAGAQAEIQTELALISRYRELTERPEAFAELEAEARAQQEAVLSQPATTAEAMPPAPSNSAAGAPPPTDVHATTA